jgi:hypothetical protein
MKLSEKVARRELEAARLARINRRRIAADRVDVVRRMLDLSDATSTEQQRRPQAQRP